MKDCDIPLGGVPGDADVDSMGTTADHDEVDWVTTEEKMCDHSVWLARRVQLESASRD